MGDDDRLKCTAEEGEMDRWQEKCSVTEKKIEDAGKELSE